VATAAAVKKTRDTDHLGRMFFLPMLEFIDDSCEIGSSVVIHPRARKKCAWVAESHLPYGNPAFCINPAE
jgi:hypothetical protein